MSALLLASHVLTTPIENEKVAEVLEGKLGTDIKGGASKDFALTENPYGKINGALINALFQHGYAAGVTINDEVIIEYPTDTGTHCVLYNPKSGEVKALIYDLTKKTSTYILGKGKNSGEALFKAFTIYSHVVLENTEFVQLIDMINTDYISAFPDQEKSTLLFAKICNNIENRILRATSLSSAGINITNISSGNILALTKKEIKEIQIKTVFSKDTPFAYFGVKSTMERLVKYSTMALLQKEFSLKRTWNDFEIAQVPVIGKDYQIPTEVAYICNHIKKTSTSNVPMTNFLIRGESGTGKTELCRAIASARKQPYVYYTCSASDEIYNLIGQMLPMVEENGDKMLFSDLITSGKYDSFLAENSLPTHLDIYCDAEEAYKQLTGTAKDDATENECVLLLAHKLISLIKEETDVGTEKKQQFQYVETDFIRAIRNGWLVEIQECGVILQPGVLVGLNGLLDQTASITLATGEKIGRHPDTIVICTTNVAYEGCRPINQSVLSRMSLIIDMPELDEPQMVERAKFKTGFMDHEIVTSMVQVVRAIRTYCREKAVDDGVCGMRELLAWISSYRITEDAFDAAKYTVVSTATADLEIQEDIMNACVRMYITD